MQKKIFHLILLFGLFFGCNNQSKKIMLPLAKNNTWYYEVRGLSSYLKLCETINEIWGDYPTFLNDSTSLDWDSLELPPAVEVPDSSIPECDTIKIFLKNITNISKESIIYEFNRHFSKMWAKKLLFVPEGYIRYSGSLIEPDFIIKFPIKKGNMWKNFIPLGSEIFQITSVDTTLRFDKQVFHNCIGITVDVSMENDKSKVKIFFNEKYGLIWYRNLTYKDEIRLLRMEKFVTD